MTKCEPVSWFILLLSLFKFWAKSDYSEPTNIGQEPTTEPLL